MKFKIGDRVKYIGHELSNHECFIIVDVPHEMSLDVEYYRDLKLKELL